MSVVFTPDKSGESATAIAVGGGLWLLFGTLTFSGSYATGGDGLDLKPFLATMGTIRQVIPLNSVQGIDPVPDLVNKKLKMMIAPVANAPTEHSAAAYNAALTSAPQPISFLCK